MHQQVIVLCPCCASAIDAVTAEQEQQIECLSCGQTWVMVVDAERHNAHSLT